MDGHLSKILTVSAIYLEFDEKQIFFTADSTFLYGVSIKGLRVTGSRIHRQLSDVPQANITPVENST